MSVRNLLLMCFMGPCLLISAGCGGGGGDDPTDFTVVLKPEVLLSGGVDSGGGVAVTAGLPVGDDLSTTSYRIVQSFSVASIPDGATILSAVYQNQQIEVVGDPYATLTPVNMVSTVLGATLGPEDYTPPAVSLMHGTLSDSPTLGLKTVDMSDYIQNLVTNGTSERLDIMLLFEIPDDGDAAFDQATFYGPPRSGDIPGIVVRYVP